jgi:hypothetical protein
MLESILASLQQLYADVLPSVIISILLVIFGWILARILKGLTEKSLTKLKIDEHIKVGKRIGFTEVASISIYWLIFLVFLNAAVDNLNIFALSEYFRMLTDFIIKLIAGIFIIIIGYAISSFIQRRIVQSKIEQAEIISQIVFIFSIIITLEMALKVIGLPTQLLDAILIVIVASIGLGLAIALGLGLKDLVASLAKKYFKE